MLAKFPALPAESKGLHSMHIAKCMYLVSNHELEVKWLVKSAEYMQNKDCFAFYIYFRLTRLYWKVLNDKQKALESGRSAYAKAMNLYPSPHHHYHAWQASLRLASILHQVDGGIKEKQHVTFKKHLIVYHLLVPVQISFIRISTSLRGSLYLCIINQDSSVCSSSTMVSGQCLKLFTHPGMPQK